MKSMEAKTDILKEKQTKHAKEHESERRRVM